MRNENVFLEHGRAIGSMRHRRSHMADIANYLDTQGKTLALRAAGVGLLLGLAYTGYSGIMRWAHPTDVSMKLFCSTGINQTPHELSQPGKIPNLYAKVVNGQGSILKVEGDRDGILKPIIYGNISDEAINLGYKSVRPGDVITIQGSSGESRLRVNVIRKPELSGCI